MRKYFKEEDIHEDNLDRVLRLLMMDATKDKDYALYESLDVSDVQFDDGYYRKRNAIFRRARLRPIGAACKKILPRVAVVLLAIMSAGFIGIMSISSLREAVWNTIVEWYDDHFTIRYEVPVNNETETEGTTAESDTNGTNVQSPLGDAPVNDSAPNDTNNSTPQMPVVTPPSTIEEIRKPTNLPDGVEEIPLVSTKTSVIIDYYNDDEWLYSFTQNVLKSREIYVDNENVTLTRVDVNGNIATVVQYHEKQEIMIFWNDGDYDYNLVSESRTVEELIMLANTVQ